MTVSIRTYPCASAILDIIIIITVVIILFILVVSFLMVAYYCCRGIIYCKWI